MPILAKYDIPGIYIFSHSYQYKLIYSGSSYDTLSDIVKMLEYLFLKNNFDLNPLEVHLKQYPSAADWGVTLLPHKEEELNLELAKAIVQYKSLNPNWLNQEMQIFCKEDWMKFIEWAK